VDGSTRRSENDANEMCSVLASKTGYGGGPE
jgi:hypothetical protein